MSQETADRSGVLGGRDHFTRVPVNLAFSYGPHRCTGSHVARAVMRTSLDELLRRLPDLAVTPDDAPTYSNSGVARNMDTLPLVFTPGAGEDGAR